MPPSWPPSSSPSPLQQAAAVSVYAHRALEAGENAYVTAVNANPTPGPVQHEHQPGRERERALRRPGLRRSGTSSADRATTNGAAEYYAFGNPQPTFDPTTHALTNLAVQVVGAAHAPNTTTNYVFQSETINLAAANGFLTNVWWSNYESYSSNGNYSNCDYNWNLNYNINGGGTNCGPVYFGPNDYLFGPVYTNDSVFVSGTGAVATSPSFGNSGVDPQCPFRGHHGRPQLSLRRQLRQLRRHGWQPFDLRQRQQRRRPLRPHQQLLREPGRGPAAERRAAGHHRQ